MKTMRDLEQKYIGEPLTRDVRRALVGDLRELVDRHLTALGERKECPVEVRAVEEPEGTFSLRVEPVEVDDPILREHRMDTVKQVLESIEKEAKNAGAK